MAPTPTSVTFLRSCPQRCSEISGVSERRRRIRVVARVIQGGKPASMREAPFRADAGHRGFVGAGVDEIVVSSLEAGVLDDLVRRGAQRPLETLLERADADTRPRRHLCDCERLVRVLLDVFMGAPDRSRADASCGRVELCAEVVVGAEEQAREDGVNDGSGHDRLAEQRLRIKQVRREREDQPVPTSSAAAYE